MEARGGEREKEIEIFIIKFLPADGGQDPSALFFPDLISRGTKMICNCIVNFVDVLLL